MSRASDYANSVSSLYAQIGEARGREAANKGAIWSGALANIGDFVSQYPERKAKLKEIANKKALTDLEKQKLQHQIDQDRLEQESEKRLSELFSTAQQEFEAGRQGALPTQPSPDLTRGPDDSGQMLPLSGGGLVQTERPNLAKEIGATIASGRGPLPIQQRASPFPTPSELLRAGGPKRAIPIINAIATLQRLDPKADPKTQMEQLQTFYKGFQNLPEDKKVEYYPGALQLFEGMGYVPKGVLPRQWDKQTEAFFMGTGQEPTKPAAPVQVQTTENGQDVTKFVIPTEGLTIPKQTPKLTPDQIADNARADAQLEIARGTLKVAQQRLALAVKNGDKPAAKKETEGLVDTVLENPALWDQLTPTVRGQIAPELRSRGYTNFGKPLSEAAMKQIAESQSAIDSLTDLRSTLKANEQYIGPVAGLSALNPYSEARKAQANIDLVRQRVGKALEGGVLRKEDEEKYKKILATLRDTPETAIYKVDSLIKNIQNNIDNFKATQKLGGRNLDLSGSAPVAKPGTPTVGSIVTWQGKRYRVKAITNGQAELEAP